MEDLHPRIRWLWALRSIVGATILAGIVLLAGELVVPVDRRYVAVGWAVLGLVGVTHTLLLYRRWQIELQDDALYLTRGVVTRVDTSVPYVRVQHTDTQRGPIERLVGLASVVVYTAGSRGADIRIPGLEPDRADELREQLRDLAVESEPSDAV